jgi:hypothetical protein
MSQRMQCPTCRREIEWSEQFPFRPFCSDRCRLIDLGAWLSEQHVVAGESQESAESRDHRPPETD